MMNEMRRPGPIRLVQQAIRARADRHGAGGNLALVNEALGCASFLDDLVVEERIAAIVVPPPNPPPHLFTANFAPGDKVVVDYDPGEPSRRTLATVISVAFYAAGIRFIVGWTDTYGTSNEANLDEFRLSRPIAADKGLA